MLLLIFMFFACGYIVCFLLLVKIGCKHYHVAEFGFFSDIH